MGIIRPVIPVKFFCGILVEAGFPLNMVRTRLEKLLGPSESEFGPVEFVNTDYYRAETGEEILRYFISFEQLQEPGRLGEIKRATNTLEQELSENIPRHVPRPVNLDPGYLEMAKVILASTKNFSHRIYLNEGIFAEVTLFYRDRRWHTLPWTFPDYSTGKYFPFFTEVRKIYHGQLQQLPPSSVHIRS